MEPLIDVLGDFASPCGNFKLTFDDNGKVAYAYLKSGSSIIGDVWVYNRCPTPDKPEWTDRRNMPFANCVGYMKEEGHIQRSITLSDVRVEWQYVEKEPKAYLFVFSEFVAMVGVGDKPGYSRFASRNGPLAKSLIDNGPMI